MLTTTSDYMIFCGMVFCICSVISIIITQLRIRKILNNDKSLSAKITQLKGEWNKSNIKKTIIPILCYLVLFFIIALLKCNPLIYVISGVLIIEYIYTSVISMDYLIPQNSK